MQSFTKALESFFGVVLRGQTYLNALYLLLAFPLGLFYFIFLVTGLSLGIGLTIVWVGLLILLVVFSVWYGLLIFERQLAIWLLRENIPPIAREDYTGKTAWQTLKASLSNPVTWKGLVYLFARFPLGLVSFIAPVTLISVSVSLLAAPLYYQWVQPQVNLTLGSAPWNPVWMIDTLPEALAACLAGIFMTLVSLHILNGLAWVSGKFARIMLGNQSSPLAPLVPTPAQPAQVPAE